MATTTNMLEPLHGATPRLVDACVEQAKALILWARKEKIQIQHLTVGEVSLVFHDAKVADRDTKPVKFEARKTIYQEMANGVFDSVSAEAEKPERMQPIVEEDDEE